MRQNAGLIVDKMLLAAPEGDEAAEAEVGPEDADDDAPAAKTQRKR